jgi:uncharacterized membrane-anchored protein YitT (DUF2179 family)
MIEKMTAVIIGSFLIGIAINGFIIPHHLMEGGMIGIGLIAEYRWGFETGLTIILLSLPIYLLTFFSNRSFFINSIHGLLLSSFFIDVLSPLRHIFNLPISSSAILGGSLIGIGIGLMLRYQTSTGGLDLLAQFFSSITPLNVGFIIFIFDFSIILTGSQLVKHTSLFYSLLTVFFVGVFTTYCTYRFNEK